MESRLYRRLTIEKFIANASKIHGNLYNYDKSIIVDSSTKTIITCKKHGDFLQTPNDHTHGRGCRKCGSEKTSKLNRKTTEEFIIEARKIHGDDKYDYSKTIYVNHIQTVSIKCRTHGEFYQAPRDHLNSYGCHCCGEEQNSLKHRMLPEEFFTRANQVHSMFYDYTGSVYLTGNSPITITCKIHGEYTVLAKFHLMGMGCKICKPPSLGVRKIEEILKLNNIEYEREKRFEQCKLLLPLPFDFYIPSINSCIEYDGEHHFIPVRWGNMSLDRANDNLIKCKERDTIKTNFCRDAGIALIRIPYFEMNNISNLIETVIFATIEQL